MRRIYSSGVALLMFLSGVWHRCLEHAKCEESGQRQERPHIEREDMRPLNPVEMPSLKLSPTVPFASDDGELAVYETLFMRRVRTPWLMESVVAPLMVPDQLPEFPKS
jgi:hypothetical protein